ncbi:MAG: serine hydrolase domain-containing protein [Usitatibacter sp.]
MAHALLGLGAFAVGGHAGGPAAPEAWQARLDSELAAIQADPAHPLASLAVLAIRDGKVVYQRQFGHRWIDNSDPARSKAADEKTLYRIASISKLVTTIGVLRLVEDGVLDLDRDIGEYLGYAVRNPHFPAVPITLRMLLSHTSSLRDDAGYFWTEGNRIEDVIGPKNGVGVEFSKAWSSQAAPGTWFQYANLPWGVVGTVMEKATGERFDRLMKRLVLDPLGIRGGYHVAHLPPDEVAAIATLYRKRGTDDAAPWDPKGPWLPQVDDFSKSPPQPRTGPKYVIGSNATLFGPHGNLHVSVADLGRVMRMLMDRGTLDGRRILEAASVEAMLARQWRSDGGRNGLAAYGASRQRFNAWGLGNQHFLDVSGPGFGDRLVEGGGFAGVGHLGDAYGLTAAFVFDPASREGLIYVTGGPGFNPETARGAWSGFFRHEEQILTALHRRAIQRKAD